MDTTSYDTLYQQLNWMSFEGMATRSISTSSKNRDRMGIATPYLKVYGRKGYDESGLQDLTDGDKNFMIMIIDRDKTPGMKRINLTEIVSANGSYADDQGLYSNGKITYTCLLTPRYGDSYGSAAGYDMLLKFLSGIESIQGYGCLHDSYEDRWCYAAFSGCSDIQLYKNSVSFKLSFSCHPEWYKNSWADYTSSDYIKISDFSSYTGKDANNAASTDKMYKLISTCPQDCPPLLMIECDKTASSWSLTFPASADIVSDTDITLSFTYANTFFVDCIAHGISSDYSKERLFYMSNNKRGLLYTKDPYEYSFKKIPYRYPVIRKGFNYIYGTGIKSLTIYPMYWQL